MHSITFLINAFLDIECANDHNASSIGSPIIIRINIKSSESDITNAIAVIKIGYTIHFALSYAIDAAMTFTFVLFHIFRIHFYMSLYIFLFL